GAAFGSADPAGRTALLGGSAPQEVSAAPARSTAIGLQDAGVTASGRNLNDVAPVAVPWVLGPGRRALLGGTYAAAIVGLCSVGVACSVDEAARGDHRKAAILFIAAVVRAG